MATVYADINGDIISVLANYQELVLHYPVSSPPGTTTTLDFDETINAALLLDLLNNTKLYSLTGGGTPLLQKSGVTQTVTNITGASTAFQTALGQLSLITPDQIRQAVTVLLAGTATTAQAQKAIAFIILKLIQKNLLL